MLHGQRKREDTSSDRKGGHILRKNWEPLTVSCLGNEWKCCIASGKGRAPEVTDLGDKSIAMLHGQRKRADTSSDRPGRQMNRNATWPAEKGGHQQ